LYELRRHLIRKAGALSVKARAERIRGDRVTAARLLSQAERLRAVARQMSAK
jgi:hypothetical protein